MNIAKRFAVLILALLLSVASLHAVFTVEVHATQNTSTEPQATEPPATVAPTTPQTNYVSRPDYSELTRLLAIADGLNEIDYTAESWAVLEEAVAEGEAALKSYWKKTVSNAEQTLTAAIAGLVAMDYSELWAVLMEVGELDKPEKVYDVWSELVILVEKGKVLLSSGDQEAVDATTVEIREALVQVKEYLEKVNTPQVVVKEVEVEVPPSGDFCNIAIHHIWPVAFAVSAILNVALVIVIVSILRKKQKQMDDTPLIDYDIDDDFEM